MNSNTPSPWPVVVIASLLVMIICWLSLMPAGTGSITWWEDHTNFTILGLLLTGLLFFLFNKPRLMAVAFAGCGLISLILNERTTQPPAPLTGAGSSFSFRIGHFSLPPSGLDADSLFLLLDQIDADLISIQDIPHAWFPRIHEFMHARGYGEFQVASAPSGQHYEMAVYTRHQLDYASLTGSQAPLTITGRLRLPIADSLGEFVFVAANLEASPGDAQLHQLARHLKGAGVPAFVLGNFNRVSWSTDIHAFKQTSALLDSWRHNLTTTKKGQPMFLEKTKSHIFHSRHFKCISFETMAGLGIVGTYQFIKNGSKRHVKKTSQKF